MFDFIKRQRRERLTAEPFPEAWQEYLRANVAHYACLTPEEREQLHDDLRVFRAEKDWEGAGGLTLTDEITVTVSALAALLTLGLPARTDAYRSVSTIIVYPAGYRAPERRPLPGGIIDESGSWRLGEAWQHGPVVLSWADARAEPCNEEDSEGRTHNVALHEFAHALDMDYGTAEGVPRLHNPEQYDAWQKVMDRAYQRLRADRYWGREQVLDPYGATNPAEFFAVATEAFFGNPLRLRRRHRRLYATLRDYYRQDPAARLLRYLRTLPRPERSPATETAAEDAPAPAPPTPRTGRAWPWSES